MDSEMTASAPNRRGFQRGLGEAKKGTLVTFVNHARVGCGSVLTGVCRHTRLAIPDGSREIRAGDLPVSGELVGPPKRAGRGGRGPDGRSWKRESRTEALVYSRAGARGSRLVAGAQTFRPPAGATGISAPSRPGTTCDIEPLAILPAVAVEFLALALRPAQAVLGALVWIPTQDSSLLEASLSAPWPGEPFRSCAPRGPDAGG